ncbi:TetR/AcrR family transcriptional regulator [Nocardia yamanashiensis]|uniref:TetR/AcrR family transcriptional regulator n=1 Tax=Nocardia yamanashiensis TaxID=209247 RepID=UPI0008347EE3|nr:TetR/AcrR family transcriptional regulator [Nocardia yamanashiensis]
MPNTKAAPAKRRYAKRLSPADRREQLLDVARRIVAESGFTEVSIAAVAERGGVTRPVVYDSFGSREELLDELIARETERMGAAVRRAMAGVAPAGPEADRLAVLRAALVRFLGEVRGMPDTWRLVYFPIDGVPPVLRERVGRARDELRIPLRQALSDWLADGHAAGAVNLEVLVRVVQSLIQTGAKLVLDDPARFDADRIVGMMDLVFYDTV